MKLHVGDVFRHSFSFTQQDVIDFARISGDHNPLHLDTEFAAQTPFKRPIIHGHLSSSIFTKILGMDFPGAGSVAMKQTTEYLRPMFVEQEYEVVFTVISLHYAKHIAEISAEIFDKTTKKITIRAVSTLINKEAVIE